MDLPAIERALAASEARPVLLDARQVRRVIKQHRQLPGVGLQVPHARCYALRREALLRILGPDELGRAAADLPEEVILLPRPEPDEAGDGNGILTGLWRYAFHARVHQEIDRLRASGALTEARVRERIHRVGQTEFDEIRRVLRQDRMLLPPGDDVETYAEFAALYLELSRFAPDLVGEVFPGLAESEADLALREDLDVDRLLAATRPEGAEIRGADDAKERRAAQEEEALAVHGAGGPALLEEARAAAGRGNTVRAALLRLQAGAVDEARADAAALAGRLARAVVAEKEGEGSEGIDAAAWEGVLLALMRRAAAGEGILRRVEARLLFDVQGACLEAERAVGRVDVVGWALSLGRAPLTRMLPATRMVRVGKKLARATAKVARVGLPDEERSRLHELLAAARRRADETLREELSGTVRAALLDVGLRPEEGNVPEQAALAKIVDELLDQATAHGYVGLGHLRDAVSRNMLKLRDVSGPGELFRGDALLAADKRLAGAVDGVHHRGEVYVRALQKGSSLLFGTGVGRALVRYVLLPVGGGFLVPFAAPLIAGELMELVGFVERKVADLGRLLGLLPPAPPEIHHHAHHHIALPSVPWVVACTVLLFGLIHSAAVRAAALQGLRAVGFVLAAIFVHLPRWVLSLPLVRRILKSRPVVVIWRFAVKPALVVAAVIELTRLHRILRTLGAFERPTVAAAVVLASALLNSRAGIRAEEAALDAAARELRRLGRHVLPGLYHLVAAFFRAITDSVDQAIYGVDEWLRFRKGQGRSALVAKGVAGLLWFAIAYVFRALVILFMEPTFNPIKHFPTVTVAAKVMWATVGPALHEALEPLLGAARAVTVTGIAMAVLPGFFGFLVWELTSNYRLYRATRPATLRPLPIGHHGETMGGLLKPGIHSGTVPKLWTKLRRAARKGEGAVEKHKEALREVAEAVERFAARELVALLAACPRWNGGAVRVAHVALASNSVRVTFTCDGGAEECVVAFEEQSGWLVAGVAQAGWVRTLDARARTIFENALAGLYHRAGVDLVREQIVAALPAGVPYDIADEGLVVWPAGFGAEWVYPLDGKATLAAAVRGDGVASAPPSIARAQIVFREQAIGWEDWVAAFREEEPRRLVKGASLLP